jgi:hypothetical protein
MPQTTRRKKWNSGEKIAGVPRKRRLGNIYRLAGRQIPIVDWNQNAAKMQAELLRPD